MNTTLKLISIVTIGALTGLVAANASAADYADTTISVTCDVGQTMVEASLIDDSATIGIARIDQGRLIPMSFGEEMDWGFLDKRTDMKFEPISASAHLKTLPNIDMFAQDTDNQIDEIRLTASDLGMKYVVIYGMHEDAAFGSFGKKAMLRTGLAVSESTPAPSAQAKALLIETHTGKVLGTVTSDEIDYGVGDLTEKVEDLVNDLTGRPRKFSA